MMPRKKWMVRGDQDGTQGVRSRLWKSFEAFITGLNVRRTQQKKRGARTFEGWFRKCDAFRMLPNIEPKKL